MKIVTSYKLQVTSFLFLVILLFPVFVFAQADQSIWSKGIVPCKGLDCSVCDVFKLVDNVIRLLWSGAALVGTVFFMYGGFLYWRGKPAEAKKVLTNVVIGIAIAFLAWIGIDTIIKLLVTQKFSGGAASLPTSVQGGVVKYGPWNQINCQAVTPSAGQGGESGLTGPGKTAEDFLEEQIKSHPFANVPDPNETEVRLKLREAGILVGGSGTTDAKPCPLGSTYQEYRAQNGIGCTSVGGLPARTIERLINIKKSCNCDLLITGGTERGHVEAKDPKDYSKHGPGNPVVDINFNQKIARFLKDEAEIFSIEKICTTDSQSFYRRNCNFSEGETHLHVQFSQ